ncbi:hypothetical protein [Lacisediminihabitans changchengi]|uniref:Uncharacterized protein n=1 Tax=Lacisediminihabitans changchengi TaxID=2787634 RepID=A0A934W204_9MICO|nr:hypothetical protein [Lacisediminihabitans changchengi]MBK4347418.1 hypothetical protein [Lacisediminihabitans changchengi]
MSVALDKRPVPKSLVGLVFVLFWVIAILLWSFSHLLPTMGGRGFMVDIGIVLASIALATPSLGTLRELRTAAIMGIVAIALFAIGDLAQITVMVYALRVLVPFLALMTPVYKLLSFRVFA